MMRSFSKSTYLNQWNVSTFECMLNMYMYAFKLKFTLMKWYEDEILVFYFGTAGWCKDKTNRRTRMFCYNISLHYNSSCHFYIVTVCVRIRKIDCPIWDILSFASDSIELILHLQHLWAAVPYLLAYVFTK